MLAVLASLWGIIPCAQADEEVYYVYTSNGKTLNMRAEANKNARVIVKIPYGDEFRVTETLGSGWSYGRWYGQYGYVMTRYLVKDKPNSKKVDYSKETDEERERRKEEEKLAEEFKSEKEISPFTIAVVATRATGWINFRYGPSKITSRIASFQDGKELNVQAETTGWYKATDPDTGKTGYINKAFTTALTGKASGTPEQENDGSQNLGTLNVNGEFNLTCKLPEGYKLQVVDDRGDRIQATLNPDDKARPQMQLSIAYDETYGEVSRMNDMSDEDLKILEDSFREIDQVEISYRETGYGTKILVAREVSDESDFIDILAIYKGYFVEFKLEPGDVAGPKRLTDEQVQMCIDFLTDVDFNPVQAAE